MSDVIPGSCSIASATRWLMACQRSLAAGMNSAILISLPTIWPLPSTAPVSAPWSDPAWRALSFIPHLAADRLASLLGEILDPRWYSSVREPRGSDIIFVDDSAKLHAFLGLKPATMAGVLGLTEPDGEGDRCRLVVDTWMTGQPDSGLAEWPGYFLWRRHRREQTQLKAVLRASQFFVDFLRLVWLDGLYTDRTAGRPAAPGKRPATEGPFAPDHFFAVSDDAVSFGRHMLAGV
jgi:hypothetical protein